MRSALALLLLSPLLASTTDVQMEVDRGAHFHFPSGVTDEQEINGIVGDGKDHGNMAFADLPFHFDMPFDDDFGEMDSFIMESAEVGTKAGASAPTDPVEMGRDDFGDEPPVLCETICRPMNASEAENAAKDAQNVEKQIEAQKQRAQAANDAVMSPSTGVPVETGMGPPGVLLEVEKKICHARGGKFSHDEKTKKHSCAPFMIHTEAKITYDPVELFASCTAEFGTDYSPCNPYQALALAHLYDVPDKAHYWLWPGGRPEQVKSAALKQEIGNNPSEGLDKCPKGRHVGFFHNWDATHVDSWGCFDDAMANKVLCCRRKSTGIAR